MFVKSTLMSASEYHSALSPSLGDGFTSKEKELAIFVSSQLDRLTSDIFLMCAFGLDNTCVCPISE